MKTYIVEFIDGKEITVDAEAYELRDSEWVFLRAERVIAHYVEHQVRGVQELPPGALVGKWGGAY